MIDLRKGVKTTVTLILYSSHCEMIAPYVCGDRVNFRRYVGYCETSNGGKSRNYVFNGYTNEPSYTIRDVFERLNDTSDVKELIFPDIDELPISGDAQFQVGKGVYCLTW